MSIHPLAIVKPGVVIEPFCYIGPKVSLLENCVIGPQAVVIGRSVIGKRTIIHPFASIGGESQSKKTPEQGQLFVGEDCVFREHVTVNVGTLGNTVIGKNVWLLAGSHVGHDCEVEDDVVVSNGSQLAGHVKIGRNSVIGGLAGIQQFCVVGRSSMIGGGGLFFSSSSPPYEMTAAVDGHVPPFSLVVGNRAKFRGINLRGLRRLKIPNAHIFPLLKVAKQVYFKRAVQSLIVTEAKQVLMSHDFQPVHMHLAKEFLEFIVNIETVRDGWSSRRAGLGIIS